MPGSREAGKSKPLFDGVGRRRFLVGALGAGAAALFEFVRPGRVLGFANYRNDPPSDARRFAFAQLRYRGGDWDPEPSSPDVLLRELERTTSVDPRPGRLVLDPLDDRLAGMPFLYCAGRQGFEPFTDGERRRLRDWIEAGGTIVGDDCAGTPGYGFDASFRREVEAILPGSAVRRLAHDHTVFRAFFLLRTPAGRRIVSPFLEGADLRERTAVILSSNDLLGALARDPLGRWVHPCVPGGERQRALALRLGINIVLYALCGDYKQDRIHTPFLRQRI